MEIFYNGNMPDIHLDWEVTRGKTPIREDFSHADVFAFLTGESGMIPLSVNVVDNVLKADIPSLLDVGEYGVKVIWVKNGSGSTKLDEILACNKRCVSEIFGLFGVSSSQYADTNLNGDVTFHIRSSAATYGYDGLSAYELAYMLGKTTLSEDAWLKLNHTMIAGEGSHSIQQYDTGASATNINAAAFGTETTAAHTSEAAFGIHNASLDIIDGSGEIVNYTMFTVGIGNRRVHSNAFEIWRDGSIYLKVGQERVCLQECIQLLSNLVTILTNNNVLDSSALEQGEETTMTNIHDMFFATNQVIAAIDQNQLPTEIQEERQELKAEQQPKQSGYYYSVPIGTFD